VNVNIHYVSPPFATILLFKGEKGKKKAPDISGGYTNEYVFIITQKVRNHK